MTFRAPFFPIILTILSVVLTSCRPELEEAMRLPVPSIQAPTLQSSTDAPTSEAARAVQRTGTPHAQDCDASWKMCPIVPTLSPRAIEIYTQGLASGMNPRAFSKIGDGEIASHWFLSIFDSDPAHYTLGAYPGLADTIAYFAGSYSRDSLAARAGFNTTRILDPLFAMNDICEVEESPLECELRRHRPSFAIISLGTNQVWTPDVFEEELRQIVQICIDRGVLPVLSTKGDNLEGDHRINAIIAETAAAYEVPLWNFWLAIQSLPDQGLQPDGEHLTWAENDFSDPDVMTHAWPVRNLSGLQLLRSLMAITQ